MELLSNGYDYYISKGNGCELERSWTTLTTKQSQSTRMRRIVIESIGNLQVSRKQNTYSLEIKEDFGKFNLFLVKTIVVSRCEKRKSSILVKKLR